MARWYFFSADDAVVSQARLGFETETDFDVREFYFERSGETSECPQTSSCQILRLFLVARQP